MENDTRKGVLTPDQEKKLDEVIKFKNKIAEGADGIVIKLIDNQAIEMLKDQAVEKFGEDVIDTIYEIVDVIFEGLDAITE